MGLDFATGARGLREVDDGQRALGKKERRPVTVQIRGQWLAVPLAVWPCSRLPTALPYLLRGLCAEAGSRQYRSPRSLASMVHVGDSR